ncbi:MAG: DUF805 domain-containing protein [Oscillospiraceae bacterium]|nr:DUF805 domain-containing protein [Oscillospiraceae bacterium]
MQEYIAMWQNYLNFGGKTNVRGFWMAMLFHFIASAVIGFVGGLIGIDWLASLYSLAVLLPCLGIQVRRLRDAGKHWAWIFINLVPLVGWIIYIVMLCKPSASN